MPGRTYFVHVTVISYGGSTLYAYGHDIRLARLGIHDPHATVADAASSNAPQEVLPPVPDLRRDDAATKRASWAAWCVTGSMICGIGMSILSVERKTWKAPM